MIKLLFSVYLIAFEICDIIYNMKNKQDYKALKKFGQNFLTDQNIIQKITGLLDDRLLDIDTIIEVGPGLGALTQHLINKNKQVDAYEIDPRMKEYLDGNLNSDNLSVILEDFLKIDLTKYENKKVAFISNLPYYITTPIIFKIIESKMDYRKIVVMMQKEVAVRLTAKIGTKEYNALSVILNSRHDIKKEFDVSPKVFIPAPKVMSSVVTITPNADKYRINNYSIFCVFTKQAFVQRRKVIVNNLLALFESRTQTENFLIKNGVDPTVRPDNLPISKFVEMANNYVKGNHGKI
jgi:16S rRNA (adenine1518-N6/adenine1519-N6)-dimethyltransferase